MLKEMKYEMFKLKTKEKDSHSYFISSENQAVGPNYKFARKNSYMQFMN